MVQDTDLHSYEGGVRMKWKYREYIPPKDVVYKIKMFLFGNYYTDLFNYTGSLFVRGMLILTSVVFEILSSRGVIQTNDESVLSYSAKTVRYLIWAEYLSGTFGTSLCAIVFQLLRKTFYKLRGVTPPFCPIYKMTIRAQSLSFTLILMWMQYVVVELIPYPEQQFKKPLALYVEVMLLIHHLLVVSIGEGCGVQGIAWHPIIKKLLGMMGFTAVPPPSICRNCVMEEYTPHLMGPVFERQGDSLVEIYAIKHEFKHVIRNWHSPFWMLSAFLMTFVPPISTIVVNDCTNSAHCWWIYLGYVQFVGILPACGIGFTTAGVLAGVLRYKAQAYEQAYDQKHGSTEVEHMADAGVVSEKAQAPEQAHESTEVENGAAPDGAASAHAQHIVDV